MSVHLVGGEMLGWSDLDRAQGPGPVGGPALTGLLSAGSGRTLVVGPHHPDLIDTLPATELTVLVRGLPDAETLAARYADRPGVQVCCGSPEKLAAMRPYDTLIALDGLARLSSVEGLELTWGEAFDLLVSVVRPGGRLLLGVENFLGLHRLLALPPDSTDSDWATLGEYDDTRPAGLTRTRGRLAAAGLRLAGTWAAFPEPLAPTALLSTDLLADGEVTGFLQATLSPTAPESPVLADPARLADPVRLTGAAIRNGAVAELAPGWVLLAERGPTTDASAVGLPAAVLVRDGRLRQVHRDPAGGWRFADGGVVPPGRTVEELVVAATLRRDLPAVRTLLTAWQAGADAGVPADQVVVTPAGTWHGLADPAEPAAALRRLASRLADAGLAHLWPAPTDELAATLATMAGREPAPPAGDAEVTGRQGWRELLLDRDRLTRELAEAHALHQWYDQTLTDRDHELKRLRRIVSLLSGTPTARAGRLLLATARRSARTARSALGHFRSPD